MASNLGACLLEFASNVPLGELQSVLLTNVFLASSSLKLSVEVDVDLIEVIPGNHNVRVVRRKNSFSTRSNSLFLFREVNFIYQYFKVLVADSLQGCQSCVVLQSNVRVTIKFNFCCVSNTPNCELRVLDLSRLSQPI